MKSAVCRALLLAVAALASTAASAQSCPTRAPQSRADVWSWDIARDHHCHLNVPVTFHIFTYTVQACDEVTWDFGDGSAPVTHIGSPSSGPHTYTTPGNYTVKATVKNALGSAVYTHDVAAGLPVWMAIDFFSVLETQRSVTTFVRRSGDTTRRVSGTVTIRPSSNGRLVLAGGTFPMVFEPGETVKELTFAMSTPDDNLWDGRRTISLILSEPSGGVLFRHASLGVLDDEPMPTVEVEDIAVREGTGTTTRLTIPFRMSGPLAHDMRFGIEVYDERRAEWGIDYRHQWSQRTVIPSGQTEGALSVDIFGDREPEEDEAFQVLVYPDYNYLVDRGAPPDNSNAWLWITILNDDAALTPRFATAMVGERLAMTLDLGTATDAALVVPLRNTRPDVLAVPESVTIPAGSAAVAFGAAVIGEGEALVEASVAGYELASRVTARRERALVASEPSLALPPGGTRTFALSLVPAHDAPVTVTLAADDSVVSVPATVTIPAGGSATVEVRGVARGETTIAATAANPGINGAAIEVNVLTMRRRAAR